MKLSSWSPAAGRWLPPLAATGVVGTGVGGTVPFGRSIGDHVGVRIGRPAGPADFVTVGCHEYRRSGNTR
jgi:hypothetical protein